MLKNFKLTKILMKFRFQKHQNFVVNSKKSWVCNDKSKFRGIIEEQERDVYGEFDS